MIKAGAFGEEAEGLRLRSEVVGGFGFGNEEGLVVVLGLRGRVIGEEGEGGVVGEEGGVGVEVEQGLEADAGQHGVEGRVAG